MEKCEWKNDNTHGKIFVTCGKYQEMAHLFSGMTIGTSVAGRLKELGVNFCPLCGADIRKPEPEQPIIKESGETWVARFDGVDYLCVDPDSVDESDIVKDFLYEITLPNSSYKPFSEIEITDEIAKLRPMVVCEDYGKGILLASNRGFSESRYVVDFVGSGHSTIRYSDRISLATVEDLED